MNYDNFSKKMLKLENNNYVLKYKKQLSNSLM